MPLLRGGDVVSADAAAVQPDQGRAMTVAAVVELRARLAAIAEHLGPDELGVLELVAAGLAGGHTGNGGEQPTSHGAIAGELRQLRNTLAAAAELADRTGATHPPAEHYAIAFGFMRGAVDEACRRLVDVEDRLALAAGRRGGRR